MKLSESYAMSIVDAVLHGGASDSEVQELLNRFLADKVKQTTKYEPELVQDCPENDYPSADCVRSIYGNYVLVADLLTDN